MKQIAWPYPVRYGEEASVDADVLVLGGGIAGCWAAIRARRAGARVVLVEKGSTIRSGSGGSGGDHWHFAARSPFCPLPAEELAQALVDNHLGFNNGIARYIQCRDSYETLLELEQMGAKVRDTEDEFAGAPFRDEATKLLYCYDYANKYTLRVWGTTFKPALHRELKRLGVELFDRTMATSLLTRDGPEGKRVVGATGFDVRTGEFRVFRAPATVLCLAYPGRLWTCHGDLPGTASFAPIGNAGDGHAMAWEAGAELAMLERTTSNLNGTDGGNAVPPYMMGSWANTWFPCSLVDAEGREVPWQDRDGRLLSTVEERTRPAPGQKFFLMGGGVVAPPHPGLYEYLGPHPVPIPKLLEERKITLPLYADLPAMPGPERRVIFGVMVGQEAKTDVAVVGALTEAGFDPERDLLQSYHGIGLSDWLRPGGPAAWRRVGFNPGGVLVDWDLRSSLEGLYAAGDQLFGGNDHSHAATTGRWAGARAAAYARSAARAAPLEEQVRRERERIYAPLGRGDGIGWKELHAAVCKAMQDYCGEVKNEGLLRLGLDTLAELRSRDLPDAAAANPHELMRLTEVAGMLSSGEATLHACLSRRASSATLHFKRSDYPAVDPPEWKKFVTVRKAAGEVACGERPFDYWLPFEENYLRHRSEP